MKVLLFHPSLLPPRDYGGVERVVLWLARGLAERGHEVWVAAFPGSRLPEGARLWEIPPEESGAESLLRKRPPGLDLVHFMAPPGLETESGLDLPQITTIHGNGKPGERFPRNSVFLSADHAHRHGASVFVYNGVDPAESQAPTGTLRGRRFLFLSKTSWSVKNARGAARICRAAGVPLTLAGGRRPWGLRARAWCSTRLGSGGLRWAGPVAGEAKARLLGESRALVFPVLWPEPFGLVVVEALLAGTPVLARRLGSLPELVTPEVGRLFGEDEREWVEFLRRGEIPWTAEACREYALKRFHYRGMAENYERLYQKAIRGGPLEEIPS
ncbi:MAG: glycosyltransferase [Bdellovibrionales bacterium]|nr:glycosyltransferase [Bdellovibrionales bacterium]